MAKSIAILIQSSPAERQAAQTALNFAQAALRQGHRIERVFFYQSGVQVGNALLCPPSDEQNVSEEWQALIKEHNLDAVVCVAAAMRRGVTDKQEAERFDLPASNFRDGFDLSGLGQWVDAMIKADRTVVFG